MKTQNNLIMEVAGGEKKYQDMIKNLIEGFFSATIDGILIDHNDAFCKILELDPNKDYRGLQLPDFWANPKLRNKYRKKLQNKGIVKNHITKAKTVNGREIFVEINSRLIKNEKGEVEIIEGTFLDVSERIIAEEKTKKLSKAVEQSPESILITDENGVIEYANPKFTELTGYSLSESIGRTPAILKSGYHSKQYYDKMWKKIKKGKVWYGEFYNKKKTGEFYWENVSIAPMKNKEGEIVNYIAVKEDITEKKKANKELILHNKRLKALQRILQNSFETIKELLDFTLTQAIEITESKIGYIYYYSEEKKQFTLNTWSGKVMKQCKVVDPQTTYDLEKTGCWGEAVRQRKPYIDNNYSLSGKLNMGTPEGHVELKKFLTLPVFVENEIKAVIGVANKETDYTELDQEQLSVLMDAVWKSVERKEYLEELVKAKEKAEESDKLKTAFLASLSHEFRTPMNGILGFSNLLLKADLTSDDRNTYIKHINTSGERLLNLINDLVHISKIESGNETIQISDSNLHLITKENYYLFKGEAEEKGISFEWLESSLPENFSISTDKLKLSMVLSILIKNAIKYTDEGVVEVGYTISENEFIEFFVKDTGIGIPGKLQNSIFNRFERADNSLSSNYDGAGLGLSIAKAYVEMLKGKIWVESELEKGSTFKFRIPILKTNNLLKGKKSIDKNGYHALKKLNILIAEDDEYSSIYMREILKNKTNRLYFAKNGNEAVQIFKQNNDIHLILMDIKMPGMDGFKATEQIRKLDKKIPIIAQTGFSLNGDKERIFEAGFNHYITKPIKKEKLYELLEKCIKN